MLLSSDTLVVVEPPSGTLVELILVDEVVAGWADAAMVLVLRVDTVAELDAVELDETLAVGALLTVVAFFEVVDSDIASLLPVAPELWGLDVVSEDCTVVELEDSD
eukprot:gb/GECG01002675.1/.p2 GENE.gb/GECG01002675.1/~~gb/GECG01002675.1/.p2  ORF type:complete len:106 (-),score=13.89 gb/GECG01002675.1/:563-880(-)